MRAALGIVSLLLALVIVGLLAKKQLASTRSAVPVLQLQPAAEGAASTGATAPGTVRAQSQQVQEQYKQAVEGLMQQARPMPEDEK